MNKTKTRKTTAGRPAKESQRMQWNTRRGDPHAPTITQRQQMERLSPFQNGDAAPKKPKTLRRMKTKRLVGVVQSKRHMFKVALPCYHWAHVDGSCRLQCEAWLEAGGVAPKARRPLHIQDVPS